MPLSTDSCLGCAYTIGQLLSALTACAHTYISNVQHARVARTIDYLAIGVRALLASRLGAVEQLLDPFDPSWVAWLDRCWHLFPLLVFLPQKSRAWSAHGARRRRRELARRVAHTRANTASAPKALYRQHDLKVEPERAQRPVCANRDDLVLSEPVERAHATWVSSLCARLNVFNLFRLSKMENGESGRTLIEILLMGLSLFQT